MIELNLLKEKYTNYKKMLEFCGDDYVMNNYIVPELAKRNIFFEIFCGDEYEYFDEKGETITREEYEQKQNNSEDVCEQLCEVYQYFIISERTAERLKEYTNELVIYNYDLDLYILCVCHLGTSWDIVAANWKEQL